MECCILSVKCIPQAHVGDGCFERRGTLMIWEEVIHWRWILRLHSSACFLSIVCILIAETMWSAATCSCLSHHDGLYPPKNKTFLSHVVLLWQKGILMPHLYCSAFCYCDGIPEPVSLWRGMGYLGSQSSGFWSMSILLCCFGPVLRQLITEEYVTELTSWLEIRGRGSCWATSRDLSLDLVF